MKEKRIKFKVDNQKQLQDVWRCVRMNINKEVTETEKDEDFLFSILAKLAAQEKTTTKPYNISMVPQDIRATWHCIHIAIENDFLPDEEKVRISMITVLSRLATLTDVETIKGVKPSEITNERSDTRL